MSISVSPLEEDRFWDAIKIRCEAFQHMPFAQIIRHQGITPQVVDFYAEKARPNFDQPSHYFLQAIDNQTGKLMAVAHWQRFDKAVRDDEKRSQGSFDEPTVSPPYVNMVAQNMVSAAITKARLDTMGDQDYWATHILAVDEQARGKGAGKALLKWGTDRADAEGWPCYLDSTPAGLALYRKGGYVVQSEVSIDLNQFGVDEVWTVWPMIRAPRPAEGGANGSSDRQ